VDWCICLFGYPRCAKSPDFELSRLCGAVYVYSSASNYVGKESILKSVILAANPVVDVLKAASLVKYTVINRL
jgi:hypothetical protein